MRLRRHACSLRVLGRAVPEPADGRHAEPWPQSFHSSFKGKIAVGVPIKVADQPFIAAILKHCKYWFDRTSDQLIYYQVQSARTAGSRSQQHGMLPTYRNPGHFAKQDKSILSIALKQIQTKARRSLRRAYRRGNRVLLVVFLLAAGALGLTWLVSKGAKVLEGGL